ncbi:hypothetical protein BHUM_01269 [Candidatus Burkholderia humilis]|nr:hypothetical protein BHUM_01269 [Candidatus Burkholderia humilis]
MIVEIAQSKLQLGMYIHSLGTSWFNHPFLRSQFLLQTEEEGAAILSAGIRSVWVDTTKGRGPGDITSPRQGESAAADVNDETLDTNERWYPPQTKSLRWNSRA